MGVCLVKNEGWGGAKGRRTICKATRQVLVGESKKRSRGGFFVGRKTMY